MQNLRTNGYWWLTIILLVGALGCGADDDKTQEKEVDQTTNNDGEGNTNNGEEGVPDCQERCVAKATSCGASAEQASQACQQDYCAGAQTEAYVSCLEGVTCMATGDPESLKAMCGYSQPEDDGDDQTCSGFPKCSGNGVQTCEIVDGVRVTETSLCAANETCSSGACEQDACVASGNTGCNALNNPSNCCDDRQMCSSNSNAAGETICCVPFNGPCTVPSDCCGNDYSDNAWTCIEGTCSLPL